MRPGLLLRILAWQTLPLLAVTGELSAQIRLENLREGETVRYPLVLLDGAISGGDGTITVGNQDHGGRNGTSSSPVVNGRYRALVELSPGPNRIRMTCGSQSLGLSLNYEPMTTDYRVRVVYVTDEDGHTDYVTQRENDPQNYRDRLDMAAKLLQCFTAETMAAQGHGRLTFALELDNQGQVIVHTERFPAGGELLRSKSGNELYSLLYGWLDERLPMRQAKNMVIMGFSGYDPATREAQAHTALGGGGQGLFSNLFLFCWPESVDDVDAAFADQTPVDRSQVYHDVGLPTLGTLASTTLGAVLHEMGHTFGLPHTSDPRCIMSRGFDNLRFHFLPAEPTANGVLTIEPERCAYFSPYMAEKLAKSRWFQPDQRSYREGEPPSLTVDWARGGLKLSAPLGLDSLVVHSGGGEVKRGIIRQFGPDATETWIPLSHLRTAIGGEGPLFATLFDRELNAVDLDQSLARDPAWYIHRWQVIEQPLPLGDAAAPPLAGEALTSLRQKLERQPLRSLPRDETFQSANFLVLHPNTWLVKTYARREISVEDERDVEVLVGGDDGFRVWLNGDLIIDQPGAMVVPIDGARTSARLRTGRNELLIESQQAGGGWGISVRLNDAEGAAIELDPE